MTLWTCVATRSIAEDDYVYTDYKVTFTKFSFIYHRELKVIEFLNYWQRILEINSFMGIDTCQDLYMLAILDVSTARFCRKNLTGRRA